MIRINELLSGTYVARHCSAAPEPRETFVAPLKRRAMGAGEQQ